MTLIKHVFPWQFRDTFGKSDVIAVIDFHATPSIARNLKLIAISRKDRIPQEKDLDVGTQASSAWEYSIPNACGSGNPGDKRGPSRDCGTSPAERYQAEVVLL